MTYENKLFARAELLVGIKRIEVDQDPLRIHGKKGMLRYSQDRAQGTLNSNVESLAKPSPFHHFIIFHLYPCWVFNFNLRWMSFSHTLKPGN